MESVVKDTFLVRLQSVQAELRAIAQSPEFRQLVQSNHYDPGLTIIDAILAITEVVDAYEESGGVSQLQPGQPPLFAEFENYFEDLNHAKPE